jgi:hypothetical protein
MTAKIRFEIDYFLPLSPKQPNMSIIIKGKQLEKAASKSMDVFLEIFTDAYLSATGGQLNEQTMSLLNGVQHSLLAYHIFREEVLQGGFVQLIQNGYGGYIFRNPFAKTLKIFGAEELSKIVYKAREIYDKHQQDLEKTTTEEEFTAMYEQYEAFDALEERFFEIEEDCTEIIARYVDGHLQDFGEISD